MSRRIEHDGHGCLRVRFRYDRDLVDRVKSLPRRRWMAVEKYWEVPEDDVVAAVDLLHPDGFDCDDEVAALYAVKGGTRDLAPVSAARRRTDAEPPLLGLFDPPADLPATADVDDRAGPTFDRGDDRDGDGHDDGWTVSGLNRAVSDLLARAFPGTIWIVGEISGWSKQRAGRRFHGFELVERDDDGREVAKVSALLWEDDRRAIERKLAEAGDPFRLEDEIGVRVAGRVELFERWGLYRVRVQDIDVRWTLGEAARRREEIVRRLIAAGLAERNAALPIPPAPLRVGVITSLGSDACADVLRTFEESGFAFRVTVHGARVQGPSTEPSVLNALDRFRAMADELDVVLICRGGGSRTDLAWFDTERLGRAVAEFPVPVVVGIGHEQDVSVLDHVARRAKTPTAAAGLVVERVRATRDRIEELGTSALDAAAARVRDERARARDRARRLARAVRHRLERGRAELRDRQARAIRSARGALREAGRALARHLRALPRAAEVRIATRASDLERVARQVLLGARRDAGEARRRVQRARTALAPTFLRAIARATERLGERERRLRLGDPRRVVERGYVILRGSAGVVTSTAQAPAGTELSAELRDGRLRLRSDGAERNE